ncbi:hypothetical protein MEZE111188_13815 [Mesobacillus zeae]
MIPAAFLRVVLAGNIKTIFWVNEMEDGNHTIYTRKTMCWM